MKKYYKLMAKESRFGFIMALVIIILSIIAIFATKFFEFVIIISIIIDVIAGYFVLMHLAKKYAWKINRTIRKYALDADEIAYDLDRNEAKNKKYDGDAFLGDKYALFVNVDSSLMVYDKTVWIRMEKSKEDLALGIKRYIYHIVWTHEDGKNYDAPIVDQDWAEEIYETLKERAPWSYTGYYADIEKMYDKEFELMKELVEQKKINLKNQGSL